MQQLYHYAPASCLASILECGAIFSRSELDARGIGYVGHSWGYTGKEEEFKDYICCSFRPHWGMIGKETEDVVVFALRVNLIWRTGSIFCPSTSAWNKYSLADLLEKNTVEALDEIFPTANTNWPKDWQAEVLVYKCIPLSHYMISVHCFSHEARQRAAQIIDATNVSADLEEIALKVTPALYPKSYLAARGGD